MSRLFWISQERILEYGCHFLLQIIFLIQGLNPHLLHWQVDSLLLNQQGTLYTHTHTCTHTHKYIYMYRASKMALVGKGPTCQCRRHKTWIPSLYQEDPLEEGMVTHFSILPRESHRRRSLELYGPQSNSELDRTYETQHRVHIIYLIAPQPINTKL